MEHIERASSLLLRCEPKRWWSTDSDLELANWLRAVAADEGLIPEQVPRASLLPERIRRQHANCWCKLAGNTTYYSKRSWRKSKLPSSKLGRLSMSANDCVPQEMYQSQSSEQLASLASFGTWPDDEWQPTNFVSLMGPDDDT